MKLTSAQIRMLESGRDTGNLYAHIHGRSAAGGAIRTVQALRKLGYINEDWHVTDAGLQALAVPSQDRQP
jgi:hypothetical protein